MKLGCHTLQWGMAIDKERRYTWDGKERSISFDEALGDIAGLGFAGFECTDNDIAVYGSSVPEFRRIVRGSGLEFVSTWSTLFPRQLPADFRSVINPKLPMSDPGQYLPISIETLEAAEVKKEVERQLEFARLVSRMGAELVTVGGPYIAREHIRDGHYRILGELLNRYGEGLEKLGMRMAFHGEVGTLVMNAEDFERLYDYADENVVKLCLETAHLTAAGEDPVKFVERFHRRIVHAHLKDLRRGRFAELGKGVVDFRGIVKALRESGYGGWLMAELDFPVDTPLKAAVRNKRYLDRLMARA